jgi:squalene cyclase
MLASHRCRSPTSNAYADTPHFEVPTIPPEQQALPIEPDSMEASNSLGIALAALECHDEGAAENERVARGILAETIPLGCFQFILP